jgi:hypothetical protein
MSTTTTSTPDTGMTPEPRKPWHRRTWVRVIGGLAAALIAIIAIGSATNHPNAAVAANPAPATSPASVRLTPAQACQQVKFDLAPFVSAKGISFTSWADEETEGQALSTIAQGIHDSSGGPLRSDLGAFGKQLTDAGKNGAQPSTNSADAVNTDCYALIGADVLGAAESAPAPAASQPATSQPAAPAPAAPAGPTASQQQALDAAQGYLSDGQGFSRAGLISQLTSKYGNGFSTTDATWAVDHSGANWDAQAVTSAKNYMSDGQGFSRSSLIDQLTSPYGSQFTYAQAEYAANQVGL